MSVLLVWCLFGCGIVINFRIVDCVVKKILGRIFPGILSRAHESDAFGISSDRQFSSFFTNARFGTFSSGRSFGSLARISSTMWVESSLVFFREATIVVRYNVFVLVFFSTILRRRTNFFTRGEDMHY